MKSISFSISCCLIAANCMISSAALATINPSLPNSVVAHYAPQIALLSEHLAVHIKPKNLQSVLSLQFEQAFICQGKPQPCLSNLEDSLVNASQY